MSWLPAVSNPYVASLVLGLSYGFTVCTSACLPFVTGYIAGVGAGFRRGVWITTVFSAGRIASYAVIGAVVGLFRVFVSNSSFLAYQKYALFVFGIITIGIGVSILFKKKSACNCPAEKESSPRLLSSRFDVRAFSLGLTRGLIICPPLVALLLYSITTTAPIGSVGLAVLFGFGTALSPLLLLGGVTGWLLNKAPLFSKWISWFGAGILLLLGADMLITGLVQK
jgi:sulfite exporter TauE/SafE